jgi:hypothetical protein
MVGVCTEEMALSKPHLADLVGEDDGFGWGWKASTGELKHGGEVVGMCCKYDKGSTLRFRLDMDKGTLQVRG